ncbi:acyl-CoA thioesterase [Microbacterium koreense]|uniref:Acyl-CoA thioesterase n=1 Tax=Microbacterium koreense TaxID=323761 RepID=A0ABW2ZT24_9MICO
MTDEVAPQRIHVAVHLRWGDLDALGHVNNVSMLKLLEEARLRAFWTPPEGGEPAPTAVFDASVLDGVGRQTTLVAHQEIEYRTPVPYGHLPLDVEMWIGRVGGSSADICFEVYSPQGIEPRVLYARSTAVVVLVDTASGRPTRLSAELRETWAPYVGEPIRYRR